MTVERFQSLIDSPRSKKTRFKQELERLIGTHKDESPIGKSFERAIDILSLNGVECFEGDSKMPPVLIKEFIKKSPDLFLLLIYWLLKNTIEISTDLQRKIVARLLMFSWFPFDTKKHTRCIVQIVEALWESAAKREFWDEPLKAILAKEEQLLALPLKPQLLRDYYFNEKIKKRFLDNKEDRWDLLDIGGARKAIDAFYRTSGGKLTGERADANFASFRDSLLECWGMVIFAQREYVNHEFADFNQFDDLDDTNTPWDWDHIYPNDWHKNAPQIIKDWIGYTGNYRVLALEQNRSEQDGPPAKRLADQPDYDPPQAGKDIRRLSFIKDNNEEGWSDDWQYWQCLEKKIQKTWVEKEKRKNSLWYYHAVVSRMFNIYRRWWEDLRVWEALGCKK